MAWILETQKTQLVPYCSPYWDGGTAFSVKRLPFYQRWHLIALHSPCTPPAKLSKTRQRVEGGIRLTKSWTMSEEGVVSIWDGLLPSCGLGRRGRDWFNELMRRGAAYLICALALHPYNDPDFIFVSLLPLWPRRNQDSSRHLDMKVTYLEWYQRLMLCLAIKSSGTWKSFEVFADWKCIF